MIIHSTVVEIIWSGPKRSPSHSLEKKKKKVPRRENSEKPQERDVTVPPTLCNEPQKGSVKITTQTLRLNVEFEDYHCKKKGGKQKIFLLFFKSSNHLWYKWL